MFALLVGTATRATIQSFTAFALLGAAPAAPNTHHLAAPLYLDKDGAYPSFEEASLERLGRQALGPLGT